jgi:hypothetical protein
MSCIRHPIRVIAASKLRFSAQLEAMTGLLVSALPRQPVRKIRLGDQYGPPYCRRHPLL